MTLHQWRSRWALQCLIVLGLVIAFVVVATPAQARTTLGAAQRVTATTGVDASTTTGHIVAASLQSCTRHVRDWTASQLEFASGFAAEGGGELPAPTAGGLASD
jgi:hypothetical protein